MQLSPSTLSVIVAALSSDGLTPTHDQVREALSSLTNQPVEPSSVDLQPGEFYLVYDIDERELEVYDTRTALEKTLTYFGEKAVESGYNRELDDMVDVHIARRRINLTSTTTVQIS